ncbi:MAG: TorF family putative porin [Gammaproteobacteria bacterium]|nr:TorF family putative porin [Gammaproteobacteria bacterium]
MLSKLLILIVGMLLFLSAQTSLAASLHADAAVTSDYVWRGISQTNGKPAVQGGLEYITETRWYFGAWVSNTSHGENGQNSPEVDYYVGLTGQGISTAYDLGVINYTYPESAGDGFTELYFSFMLEFFTVKYSTSSDVGTYIEASTSFKLPFRKDSSVNFHVGQYQLNNSTDYMDANVSVRISEFSLTVSKTTTNSPADKDYKTFVTWNRIF